MLIVNQGTAAHPALNAWLVDECKGLLLGTAAGTTSATRALTTVALSRVFAICSLPRTTSSPTSTVNFHFGCILGLSLTNIEASRIRQSRILAERARAPNVSIAF
jgi:hypothetical protein